MSLSTFLSLTHWNPLESWSIFGGMARILQDPVSIWPHSWDRVTAQMLTVKLVLAGKKSNLEKKSNNIIFVTFFNKHFWSKSPISSKFINYLATLILRLRDVILIETLFIYPQVTFYFFKALCKNEKIVL